MPTQLKTLQPSPDISICSVVPAGDASIEGLFASALDTADPVAIETIAVLNGDAPQLAARLDRLFPDAKILENRAPFRLARARNQALRLATGRYLSLWDHDAVLLPGCLLQLALFLDEHPETGIVVPCIEDSTGKVLPSARRFPGLLAMLCKYSGLASFGSRSSDRGPGPTAFQTEAGFTEIDWAVGSAMVVRRETLEEIGFFDERYLAAYEDADFCRRAKRAGWHVAYIPAARVRHDKPARYKTDRVLDVDPLAPAGTLRTHPEQLLDAVRFLLDALKR